MHTEAEIRRAIKPLLDRYGQLNTSQVKQKLEEVLIFDEDDKELSSTRKEAKIMQRIGNIVAHQSEEIKIYEEGFTVNKKEVPALFTAVKGLSNGTLAELSDKDIKVRQQKSKSFHGRDIDWAKKYEDNSEIGNLGEEFVYQCEKDKVAKFSKDDVDRVQHLSKLQGDGLGYDISSIDDQGNILRIEVKTTSKGEDTVFYMSKNERDFFEQYKDDGAVIYRVYNFDKKTRRGIIKEITAVELLNNYNFDPITFAVTKK